ncbi:MAG: branched-chain amino acid ABC transporter permease [Alphaproteobacteria bacterium]
MFGVEITADLLMQTTINALWAASFAALLAVGLVLIFGVMGVINFAHGELYMLGAYVVWYLYGENGWAFPIAVLIAILAIAGFGMVMERTLFRPMRGNPLGGLIISVGLLFVLQVVAVEWGGVGLMKHVPSPYQGAITLFGNEAVSVSAQRLLVVVAAIVLLGALWLFLYRTRIGWAMRAVAQDMEAASLQGIGINRFSLLAMAIGAGLAGAAGAFMSPLVRVDPNMGGQAIITAFIVIIVGGIGSLEGAVLAAVLFSFFHTFVTTLYDGTLATILGLVIMMVVLVIKPTGIMGTVEKV